MVLVVGHINEQLDPVSGTPEAPGAPWLVNLVRTTASFSTGNPAMRWLTGGMTHHLAHHLRPVAVRSELPRLHDTVVRDVAKAAGLPLVEYRTLAQAMAGHRRRLYQLGHAAAPAAGPVGDGRTDVADADADVRQGVPA